MKLTDQLIDSSKYIPFAEGASADYLGISITPESAGKIFYFHHESDDEQDLFLISNSIKEFLINSFVRPKSNTPKFSNFISGPFVDDYFD